MNRGAASRFKLVVAIDGGEDTEVVLTHAFDQAGRHERPEVHVLRVIETRTFHNEPPPGALEAASTALRELVVEELEAFTPGAGDWSVRLHARAGKPADEILSLAAEVEASLIVVGHGIGHRLRRGRLGVVAEEVMRLALAPVLLARALENPDHALALQQCPECVAMRDDSQGDRWFCERHSGAYLGTSTLLMPSALSGTGHGPMW